MIKSGERGCDCIKKCVCGDCGDVFSVRGMFFLAPFKNDHLSHDHQRKYIIPDAPFKSFMPWRLTPNVIS